MYALASLKKMISRTCHNWILFDESVIVYSIVWRRLSDRLLHVSKLITTQFADGLIAKKDKDY